jgi:dipeptidyl aminopeptidase/acylaminoacyl peptidase
MGISFGRPLLAALALGAAGAAAASTPATPAAGTTGPASVTDFVRQPDFSDVSISPDGKYLAALVPIPGKPYENLLAVLDGQTAKVVKVLRSGRISQIASYFWTGHDRLLASMAVRRNGLDTPALTGELFAIDPDGTHAMDLFGYRAGKPDSMSRRAERRYAFATPISDQTIGDRQILIAVNDYTDDRKGSYTEIDKLDVDSGRTVDVGRSPERNARLVADHLGRVRVAYADNDYAGVKLWMRTDDAAPWTLVNDAAKSHISMLPVGFNRDNSKLYVRVARGPQPDAIELLDVASGRRTLLFQGRFADPGKLLPTADGQDYYAVVDQDGPLSLFYLDANSAEARLSKALAANFPGQLAYFSSFTRDGKHAIVHVLSDRNPGDFYLFDLATRSARYLLSAEPWIDPRRMRPMQPIMLSARDGLLLHGFLTLPAGDKPFPLVVLPHGGPHGVADHWQFDPEVQLFASRGYAVLQVNYRGSGGYGARFQQLGYRQWGLSMQDDLTDATRWAIAQGYADPHRICIYGASYGGYAALEGAVREPDLYKCAIGYAGVYDLRVQLTKSDTERTDSGDAYLHLALGTDPDDLLRRSPLAGVGRIKANLLLLHGEDDPRAPFKNFQEFTEALKQAGKPYEALVEPHEGHGFFLQEHRQEAYRKMLDFLDRNIGPASASAGDAAH